MTPDGLRQLDAFIKTLPTVRRVEILPYHTLGLFKWQNLGIPYPLDGVRVPTAEEVETAEQLFACARLSRCTQGQHHKVISTKILGNYFGENA